MKEVYNFSPLLASNTFENHENAFKIQNLQQLAKTRKTVNVDPEAFSALDFSYGILFQTK